MIRLTAARNGRDLQQILDLQQRNLATHLSPEEAAEQGFVTARHDLPLLERICGPHGHVVAMDGDRVVGYALVMLREFGAAVPILVPMFEQIERLLGEARYVVMGQVCVEKAHRGQGVFAGMYDEFRRRLSGDFDLVVTEVATRNTRSLRAHEKVGFRRALQYQAHGGESWEIVTWDWTLPGGGGVHSCA